MRLALGLSYDGTAFRGWQTQPGGHTLQDALEAALSSFLNHPCNSICAGRTDTGVHALQQVVHIDTQAERSAQSWIRGLNALLPSAMAVNWVQKVNPEFHARFNARKRHYLYVIRNHPVRSPFMAHYAAWVFRSLDLDAMRQASRYLLGEHDFTSFRSSQCQAKSPVRTLYDLTINWQEPYYFFSFSANAFLHHMIRNIMGALVDVGLGRRSPEWLARLLELQDRSQGAATFAPQGLYLAQVDYDETLITPDADTAYQRLYTLTGITAPSLQNGKGKP